MLQLARYTCGTVDATLDCKGVFKKVRSVRPLVGASGHRNSQTVNDMGT